MLALFFVVGCTQLSLSQTLTPGDRFRQRMAALEAQCRRDPPTDPRNTRCRPLQIKPEDWLATPEGRFAHSIRIPNPVPADSGYRPGMTPVEYFEHLCKNEAGEFIFKTVDNVEGIRLLRPREPADDYMFQDLYAMEDPYGHWQGDAEEPGFQFVGPSKYAYIETPLRRSIRKTTLKEFRHSSLYTSPAAGQTLERYVGYNKRSRKSLQLEYDSRPKSRYAITWRGIKRPNDREMGIAGGELIALDLDTNEVLGVRRGYALYHGSWEMTRVCPRYGHDGGFDKTTDFTFWFAGAVLRPPGWSSYIAEREKYRKK
jgi:hypothetical protein